MENDRNILKNIIPRSGFDPIRPHWYSFAAKRLMDVLAALLGLIFLAPLFVFIGILIKRDSPGPAFYRGPRMGRGGRVFQILKFRTMREDAASYAGPGITAEDDPRITPLGKWLRDTKINELPQLWNIFLGDMSLVGPRPENPEIVETWPEPARAEILSMRPGITSPASVAYHDEEMRLKSNNVMDHYMEHIVPDKLRLDLLYVRHHTFLGDMDALFWTFVILIPRLKEKKIPEGWLFGGPVSRFLRRYVRWALIDFLIAFLSIDLIGIMWRLYHPLDLGFWRAFGLASLLAILFSFFNILLGLKSVSWSRAAAEDVLKLIVSCGLVTTTIVVLQMVFLPKYGLPSSFMYVAGTLVLAGFVAARYRLRLLTGLADRWINLRHSGYGAGERILVVGAGEGSRFVMWLLGQKDFRKSYTIVGIADDDPAKQGMHYDGLKVLGTIADIPQLVQNHDIEVLFYAISKISNTDDQRILSICKKTGLRLIKLSNVMTTLRESLTDELPRFENELPHPEHSAWVVPNVQEDVSAERPPHE
jgi:lipopolysaccharide/colanic/teichoic acid biosynthesis glycosyltransferase